MQYNPVTRNHAVLCDGGDPNGLVYPLLCQPTQPYPSEMEFMAQAVFLSNYSGSPASMGAGVRKSLGSWKAGQWTNATTTYTDDTTDAQDAGANDFPLETTSANDGFIVLCKTKFNLINLLIGTAGSGTGSTHDFAYSKAGSWTTFAIGSMIVGPLASHWTAAETLIWWDVFPDWALTTGAEATGIPAGYYAVRVRATTPPGTVAALATTMSVHLIQYLQKAVASGTRVQLVMPGSDIGSTLGVGECATVAFSVASVVNRVEAEIRTRG